jgi:hypothetical protein
LELPINSAIQIVSFPSRNLEAIFESYYAAHLDYGKVKEKERLQKHNENRLRWLKQSIKNGLINDRYQFYPKNWVTVATVMVPEFDLKSGREVSDSDVFSLKSKALSKLSELNPRELQPGDLIKIMSELTEPFKNSWSSEYDENIEINKQRLIEQLRGAEAANDDAQSESLRRDINALIKEKQ